MGKLLITIRSAIDELAVLAGSVPVSKLDVLTAASALGDTAVIRGGPGSPRQGCFAIARVASIHASTVSPLLCELRIRDLRFLREIVSLDVPHEKNLEGSGLEIMPLADEVAAEITRSAATSSSPPGFAEEQTVFTLDAETHSNTSVLAEVLAAYHDTCAFTGTPLLTSSGGRALEPVATLRPLAAGGDISAGNLIAAIPEARLAMESGYLTLGSRFEFIAVLDRLDPELQVMLNPSGRLRLPAVPQAMPSAAAIAYHQSFVFNRPL